MNTFHIAVTMAIINAAIDIALLIWLFRLASRDSARDWAEIDRALAAIASARIALSNCNAETDLEVSGCKSDVGVRPESITKNSGNE